MLVPPVEHSENLSSEGAWLEVCGEKLNNRIGEYEDGISGC